MMRAVPLRVQVAAVRALFGLPRPVLRALAGRPIERDGQRLAPQLQLLLRLQSMAGLDGLRKSTVARARREMSASTALVQGDRDGDVATRELTVDGSIRCRLYRPAGLGAAAPLLIFYHGGGWVIGDLDTHDNLCRFLATRAGVAVLSVDYRLAPEHPFPAATEDALAAYRYALANAEQLDVDPGAIALGGDSAGGNLAAVTALSARGAGLPAPAFLLLIYPGTDFTVRRASRELFGDGFLLTDTDITWFSDHYVPMAQRTDPRASPLLAPDMSGLPPTHVVTAGFDPIRDDGEAFAAALGTAGVPVSLRRHPELVHGFANLLVLAPCREAVAEMAGALRAGLRLSRQRAVSHPPRRGVITG